MKIVYLNGKFVPAEAAQVSVFDRSFLYGDALFETARIYQGKPFRWRQHWERLLEGACLLRINVPLDAQTAFSHVRALLQKNNVSDALVRVHLSRGVGVRGYSTTGADSPLLLMSLHEAPSLEFLRKWTLQTATSVRVLKNDPLARIKSANKLLQVLARAEAEENGFDEALLLNADGEVAEATSGNIFWIKHGSVYTPPLDAGILPGITRAAVLEVCRRLNVPSAETAVTLDELKQADGAFLTLSSYEMIEVGKLDETCFRGSDLIKKILQGYHELVALEIGRG